VRGEGYRNVCFAGARWPDPEDKIGLLYCSHVRALRGRAGIDAFATGRDLRPSVAHRGWIILLDVADQPIDVAGAYLATLLQACIKFLQHVARQIAAAFRSFENYDVAMSPRLDIEPILNQCQMRIMLAQ
jgi:hypothetical protein